MASRPVTIWAITFLLTISSLNNLVAETSRHLHNPSSFDFVWKLQGSKKGNKVEGISKLKNYLQTFGYLNHKQSIANDADYFDEVTESALKSFQTYYKLNVTGTLDAETVQLMSTPRCGVPDVAGNGNFHALYNFFPGQLKWNKQLLNYAFKDGTREDALRPAITALDSWSFYSRLVFNRTDDPTKVDIIFSFEVGDHGDGAPFDGPGGIVGHAFAPIDGRVHWDGAEIWSPSGEEGKMDIRSVSLHEIGHVLGLAHSNDKEAAMYAYISPGEVKNLTHDDTAGIKALYNVKGI